MGCGAVSTKPLQQPTSSHLSLNRIYQRLQLIGSGTYGKVYLCRNNLNGLHYALKVVDITAITKEEAVKQIETLKGEIRVLRKLNHPNIVKYYSFDISEDDKQVEIVLQYAQKGCLKDYVKERGGLREEEVCKMMAQVLEGLRYLHRQNIVHRDLKCANILIMEDGTLKITDFGTAKRIEGHSLQDIAKKCASLKGTPYYMAPQILRRTGHSISADIWSLGCLAIQMLTGRAPYTSITVNFEEIIGYIVTGIPPPFPKNVSEECQKFLNCCLDAVPSQRMTSEELMRHPWIEGTATRTSVGQIQTVCRYKASLSKTNDEIEDIEDVGDKQDEKGGKMESKREKMKEIEAYLRSRQSRKRTGNRTSAKPKKEKYASANVLLSEPQLPKIHQFTKQLQQQQPLARQLFPAEPAPLTKISNDARNQHHLTAPNVKAPQTIIGQLHQLQPVPSHQSNNKDIEIEDLQVSLPGQKIEGRLMPKSNQKVIDTMISREERLRFLQQQRILQEQREQQRLRWEQELKEGASYLKREISSRYMP